MLGAVCLFLALELGSDLRATLDARLRSQVGGVVVLLRSLEGDFSDTNGPLSHRGDGFGQVLDASGRVLDSTPNVRAARLLTPAQFHQALVGEVFVDRRVGGGLKQPTRMLATHARSGHRDLVVVVGTSLDERNRDLSQLHLLLVLGGLAALLLASAAGYFVIGLALRPVERMRRRAADISANEPGARLPVSRTGDELARLSATLNAMLARLEEGLARERRFVADASHELRTPLAILQAESELALRGKRSTGELAAALRSTAEETHRLARLADDLLVIARAEDGRVPLRAEDVELDELLARVLRGVDRTARPGVSADDSTALLVRADPLRLQQALGNLVDNALRHGAPPVRITAEPRAGDRVRIHVLDAGPGLPPGFREHAFERFSRPEGSRATGGAGLGLAIVRAIARAHGGEAGIDARPEGGADVWIELDAAPAPARPEELPTSHRALM